MFTGRLLFTASSALLLLAALGATAAQAYPEPVGFVNDFADVIAPELELQLEAELSDYQQQTGCEIAVVTLMSLEGRDVADYTIGLFNAWGVGAAEKDNGVVLLYAPHDRELRVEFGNGFARRFSVETADAVMDYDMLPLLRDPPRRGEGMAAGARGVMRRIDAGGEAVFATAAERAGPGAQSAPFSAPVRPPLRLPQWLWYMLGGGFALIFGGIALRRQVARETTLKQLREACRNGLDGLAAKLGPALEGWHALPGLCGDAQRAALLPDGEPTDNNYRSLEASFDTWDGRERPTRANLERFERYLARIRDEAARLDRYAQLGRGMREAKKRVLEQRELLPARLETVRAAVAGDDVRPETQAAMGEAQAALKVLELERVQAGELRDWLELDAQTQAAAARLDQLQAQAAEDRRRLAEARERTPELLAGLPQRIAAARSSIGANPVHGARAELEQAEELYRRALELQAQQRSAHNLWMLYELLEGAERRSQSAVSAQRAYVSSTTRSSSSAGSFRGGSGGSSRSSSSFGGGSSGSRFSGGGGSRKV